jgi:hypothetical protein
VVAVSFSLLCVMSVVMCYPVWVCHVNG